MKNLLLSILAILTLNVYGQLVPTLTNVSAPQPPSITGKTGNIFSNSIKNTNGAGYAAFAASVGNNFGAGYTSLFGTDPNKNAYIYNSRGLIIPRLTTVQRDAVSAPQTGLMVFNTTTNRFNWYSGGTWNEVGTGSGTVTSVSGTAGRITSTGGATPQIDIDGSYTGQNSITTLGTIGTGTWNADVIGTTYGGTGVDITNTALSLGGPVGTSGRLSFYNSINAFTATIASGVSSSDYTLTLPVDDGAAGQYLQTDGSGVTSWQTVSSTPAISALTAAVATNNINNGNYFQRWRWDALEDAPALWLSSSSTTAVFDQQTLLQVELSGVNANPNEDTYAMQVLNSHGGAGAVNNGIYIACTNGASNRALVIPSGGGNVGIGVNGPSATLDVVGTLQYSDGNQAANKVLTSDASGNATWQTGVGGCEVSCGTYTPTLNAVTNIDALTAYQCQYLRVGDNVTVSGMLLVDVTNTATDSEFTITLPIASTFSSGDFGIGGAGSFINIEGSTALVCGPGDTFGSFRWLSSATTTTAQRISFTFTYQIL